MPLLKVMNTKFSGLIKVMKDIFTGNWEGWDTENWGESSAANWEDLG